MLIQAVKLLQSKGSSCVFLLAAAEGHGRATTGGGGRNGSRLLAVLEESPVPVVVLDAGEGLDSNPEVENLLP